MLNDGNSATLHGNALGTLLIFCCHLVASTHKRRVIIHPLELDIRSFY